MSETATKAYLMQRVTGAIMIPISFWILFALVPKVGSLVFNESINRNQVLYDMFGSINSLTYILIFVFCGLYHGIIGMESIIKDYIHCSTIKKLATIAIYGLALFTMVFLTIFSIDTHIQAINNFDKNKEVEL
jgi:succinate dehydrogenase / fumarate reductase membrane anchor subunit